MLFLIDLTENRLYKIVKATVYTIMYVSYVYNYIFMYAYTDSPQLNDGGLNDFQLYDGMRVIPIQ